MPSLLPLAQADLGTTGFWLTALAVAAFLLLFMFFVMMLNRFKRCPSKRSW